MDFVTISVTSFVTKCVTKLKLKDIDSQAVTF